MSKELTSKEVWEKLKGPQRVKLKDYYRTVLRRGILKEKSSALEKEHKKLMKWAVSKKLTIWDLPKKIFQGIQIELTTTCMETPL